MQEPDPVTDVQRATRAILDAPQTTSGLIVPPHVLDAQRREEAAAAAPVTRNRAQRRRAAKYARSAAARRQAALYAQHTPEQQEALAGVKEATESLTEEQLEIASVFMARLAKMTPIEREQALEDFERGDNDGQP